MEEFIRQHQDKVTGILHGFDRVLFKGSLLGICSTDQLDIWLSSQGVLYKDFTVFAESLTRRIKEQAAGYALEHGRPYEYLASPRQSKEERAKEIAERDNVSTGLVCVLSCVEPCQTICIGKDVAAKKLKLKAMERQCQHFYFYFIDKRYGWMHVRLQSWLPFTIQVYLNGREYLGRQLERAKIEYERRDNCFVAIADIERAQKYLRQLEVKPWQNFLKVLARRFNPLLSDNKLGLRDYYWSIKEAEYASDVLFKDSESLHQLYPSLVRHAIENFSSQHVLRFLGRKVNSLFAGEVTSAVKHRSEGTCIKHRVEENSIKMYDKQGSVLRIETTINNPRRFRVWREQTRHSRLPGRWLPMRRGIADIPRRVAVSLAANMRYLEALAVVNVPCPACEVLDPVSEPVTVNERELRPLRPITIQESAVFTEILRGEFRINGFANKHLRRALLPDTPSSKEDQRRASAKISRQLALLRAHKLIAKVPKANLYRVTKKGDYVMNTALNLRRANLLASAA